MPTESKHLSKDIEYLKTAFVLFHNSCCEAVHAVDGRGAVERAELTFVFSLGDSGAGRGLSELPIDGGHVGVDGGAGRRARRRVRRAAGLAARHLRALLAAASFRPFVLHLVPPHSPPTLSNGISTPYKGLICNETSQHPTRLPANHPRKERNEIGFITLKDSKVNIEKHACPTADI